MNQDDDGLLGEIFVSASSTSTLTETQRAGLKRLLLKSLSPEEAASVDRILRAIRQGTIKIV
jgi:hypothetical protein